MIARASRRVDVRMKLIIAMVLTLDPPRDLDFFEVCSGWGESSFMARALGLAAQEYDGAMRAAGEDLVTVIGQAKLFYHGARLKPGALCWLSPECSCWGHLSCPTNRRWFDVVGYVSNRKHVQQGLGQPCHVLISKRSLAHL